MRDIPELVIYWMEETVRYQNQEKSAIFTGNTSGVDVPSVVYNGSLECNKPRESILFQQGHRSVKRFLESLF